MNQAEKLREILKSNTGGIENFELVWNEDLEEMRNKVEKTYYVDINNAQEKEDEKYGVRNGQDQFTCAIKTTYAGEKDDTYEVRLNNKGALYNPYSPQWDNEPTEMQRRGKTGPEFEEVSEEIFELYLRFLNSYRAGHLRNAENLRSQPKQGVILS